MNNSSCDVFSSSAVIIFSAANGTSLFVCLLAATLLCILKLHSKTVYRLALYQVLSASAVAAQSVGQVFLLKHPASASSEATGQRLCKAFAFLFLYTEWVKLLFVAWVTVHLFCYAVFHKNLKRLEVIYIATSVIIPAGIASVPFTTDTYGVTQSWCWIQSWKNNCFGDTLLVTGVIEQFALWFGPAMTILSLSSVAMFVMMIILIYRAFMWRSLKRNQNWKAVKQLLPLVAYPVLFFIFIVPQFIGRVYAATDTMSYEQNYILTVTSIACEVGWSLSAGIAQIIHLVVIYVNSHLTSTMSQYPIYQAI